MDLPQPTSPIILAHNGGNEFLTDAKGLHFGVRQCFHATEDGEGVFMIPEELDESETMQNQILSDQRRRKMKYKWPDITQISPDDFYLQEDQHRLLLENMDGDMMSDRLVQVWADEMLNGDLAEGTREDLEQLVANVDGGADDDSEDEDGGQPNLLAQDEDDDENSSDVESNVSRFDDAMVRSLQHYNENNGRSRRFCNTMYSDSEDDDDDIDKEGDEESRFDVASSTFYNNRQAAEHCRRESDDDASYNPASENIFDVNQVDEHQ